MVVSVVSVTHRFGDAQLDVQPGVEHEATAHTGDAFFGGFVFTRILFERKAKVNGVDGVILQAQLLLEIGLVGGGAVVACTDGAIHNQRAAVGQLNRTVKTHGCGCQGFVIVAGIAEVGIGGCFGAGANHTDGGPGAHKIAQADPLCFNTFAHQPHRCELMECA